MPFVTAEGSARPFELKDYARFGDQIPALRSFYLTYSGNDHELLSIHMLPGGRSVDLSPNADLSPSDVPDGKLSVGLLDEDPEGEGIRYKVSHTLLAIPGARRFQFRDVGCVDQCTQMLPIPSIGAGNSNMSPPIIALVGFQLQFIGSGEKKLDRIGITFRGTELNVAMRGQNGNDTFRYLVDFVVIPTDDLNVSTGEMRGTATMNGGTKISLPGTSNMEFLLTGWRFNFVQGEHRIRDLGVVRSGAPRRNESVTPISGNDDDNVILVYGDEGANDPFHWLISFAQIELRPTVLDP